ncbi:MAG: hypothetical protein K2M86_01685, partial [Odoribacter sp.]|nr:hypothetical protein [Odoribacter sp.]
MNFINPHTTSVISPKTILFSLMLCGYLLLHQDTRAQQALKQLLTPLKLDFEIINNTIVASVANDMATAHGKPQNVKITGVVYDEKGLPLPGATSLLLGTLRTGPGPGGNGHFT